MIKIYQDLLLKNGLKFVINQVAFKNNATFINCISKINGMQIDNTEDLDAVMPMYYLLEYSKNYRTARGILWNYYRDEPSNPLFSNSESFKRRTTITGNTYDGDDVDDDVDKVGKNESRICFSGSCCSTKTFKKFLETFKYIID